MTSVVSPVEVGIAMYWKPPFSAAMPVPPCIVYIGPPSAKAAGAATSAATTRTSARVSMPFIRLRAACRSVTASDFDQQRVALAAAGADRSEAEPAAVAPQLVDHRPEDAAAACADRMAERDRAAVHVR